MNDLRMESYHKTALCYATAMKQDQPTVARSTALMSVATLTSRVTGLARTFVMAAAVGTTYVTSAYQIANTMPNMIYELVLGGLLNAAFVPLYLLMMEKHGREGGNRYASNLLNIVILVMGALSILATVFAPQVIATQTMLTEQDAAVVTTAIFFFRIFAVQLLFYGISGVVTSMLNANRVFFLPSIAPAFNNIVVIASFVAYMLLFAVDAQLALILLAVGTTLGVLVQLAIQIPAFVKLGFKWSPRIDFKDPGFIDTLKTGVPMVIYVVGMLAAFTFRHNFSLVNGDAGPATLFYAWMWFQLPHGVIAVSLSRALFTEMSKSAAADDMGAFRRFMQNGNTGTLLCMIPLAGLMCVLSTQIMQMFRMGAFTADDVATVALVLSVWVLALPVYSFQLHLFNVFASLRRFTTFSLICTSFCALQCALYAVLSSPELLGLVGICVADIVYYAVTVVVLLIVLRRYVGEVGVRGTLVSSLKALAATLLVVGLLWFLLPSLPYWAGPLGGFAMVVLYGAAGLAAILVLYKLLRIKETDLLFNAAKRFLKRS
ncbi:MAG: murein biosynthesis integral membrane protein MurJ [Coriobacteriia bacterium]|nr:murein biosynthesis integral membrane protein MurJ [Coriobacteriia bacterium]